MPNQATQHYRVSKVASMLGLHKSTVYRLVASGALEGIRVGGSICIPADAYDTYLQQCEQAAVTAAATEVA
ncbi:excisionase family DNA-binding protein [Kutzneria albida]|uniref:Helix-turn-helix domain-containing protein n=1 Tax=Kutzneria albida DSM 43870 TaxID=1449976 RepID=W5WCF3_9PSEU|nr:excisionase family DNA-binding protein [Kutzneria albida]AHH98201.1 hypothetical protein KALB_4839 [Kutzneria albida DSM 43870]